MANNPAKLVDGLVGFSSVFELLPDNIGATVTVDIGDTVSISHVRVVSPSLDFRLRGFEFLTSSDGVLWTVWDSSSANIRTNIDTLLPTRILRWFRIHVTKTDQTPGGISTLLSEIFLWAEATRPMVLTAGVSAPPSDTSQYQTITWTTALWDTSKTVSIGTATPAGVLLNVASHVPNNGTFRWHTSDLPDGAYVVRISPDTVGLSGAAAATVSNFVNRFADLVTPGGSEYVSAYPPLATPAIDDTITFLSRATSRHGRTYARRVDWSPDSGRSWFPVVDLLPADTQLTRISAALLSAGARYGFLRLAVVRDTVIMTTAMGPLPIQTASLPPGTTLRHTLRRQSVPSSFVTALPLDLLSYRSASGSTLLPLVDGLVVSADLDTLSGYGMPTGASRSAAADLNGDGSAELVLSSGIISRPEMGPPEFFGGAFSVEEMSLFDMNGDDTLEIWGFAQGYDGVVRDHRMLVTSIYQLPQVRAALPMNVSGDGRPEVVTASTNTVTVFNSVGQALAGYPMVLATTSLRWVLPFQADDDPQSEFLVLGDSHLYVVNDSAQVLPGFPRLTSGTINRPPIVADLDGDGREDIIYTQREFSSPVRRIYAVDREGQTIPGWPRILPENYRIHVRRQFNFDPPVVDDLLFEPTPSILAASIDGDHTVELLVFGANGMLTIFRSNGDIVDGYPVFLGNRTYDTPVLGDFDDDGALDLVYRVYQEQPERSTFVNVEFPPGSYNSNATPWPMYMANARRTGKANPTISVGVKDDLVTEIPAVFSIRPNYPNPFNPSTTIEYSLPRDIYATVRVTDLLGRIVATLVDGPQTAGLHRVRFDADRLPTGVYIVSVAAGSDRALQKMLLLK